MKQLPNELVSALNQQIGREYMACHSYWAMEWALLDLGWKGLACWAHEEGSEERHHGKKIAYYMLKKRGARPQMPMTPSPSLYYDMTPIQLFQAAASLEADMTDKLTMLYGQAEDLDDTGVCLLLEEYLEKQECSEAKLAQILKLFSVADDEGAALILLDKKYKP